MENGISSEITEVRPSFVMIYRNSLHSFDYGLHQRMMGLQNETRLLLLIILTSSS